MVRARELLGKAIIPILRTAFLLVVAIVAILLLDYLFGTPNPIAVFYLPNIIVSAPTTEVIVAIAEVVVALGIIAGIGIGALPF